MYLLSDQCPFCSKKIDPSSHHAPHNIELASLFPGEIRAYFCSRKHVEQCFTEYYPEGYGEDTEAREKAIVKRYIAQYGGQVNPDLRPDNNLDYGLVWFPKKRGKDSPDQFNYAVNQWVQKEIQQLRDEQEELDAEARQNAPKQFANEYIEARQRVTDEEAKQAALEAEKNKPRTYADCCPDVKEMFDHVHILGPSGSGKSTFIKEMLLPLINHPQRPAIILIDPKGNVVEEITKLKAVQDRLVLIDLNHDPAPPLNLFRPMATEAATNYAIENFDFLFSQAGQEMTPRMRPVFRFCARLMFSIPNADIELMMQLLEGEDDKRFRPHIDALSDDGVKRFFLKDFYQNYGEARKQIKSRFQDIYSMPRIRTAFNSQGGSFSMDDCLRERKIVLVNTGLTTVGPRESVLLGRHIINLTVGAAFARGVNGPPALLFIDEFQDFVDEIGTPKQLRLARNYSLGIILAHQQMYCDELNDQLRSSISTNTSSKYCAQLKGKERGYMLTDLGCSPEFLDAQVPNKQDQTVRFACVLKGKEPVSIIAKWPNITPDMQVSEQEYAERLSANRRILYPKAPTAAVPAPPTPLRPDPHPAAPPSPQDPTPMTAKRKRLW
jgi:FtsK/SpoIIIE family